MPDPSVSRSGVSYQEDRERRDGPIIEERSWYSDGFVVCRDRWHECWWHMPYRRFTVPWRGGRAATPWVKRQR